MNKGLMPIGIDDPEPLETAFEKDYIKNLYQTEAKKLSIKELSVLDKIIHKAPIVLLYGLREYGLNFIATKYNLGKTWQIIFSVTKTLINKLIVKIHAG